MNGSEKPPRGLLGGRCLETGNLKAYQVKPTEEGSTGLQLILLCSAHDADEQKPGENKEVGDLALAVSRAGSHSPRTPFGSETWGSQQLTFVL